MNEMLIGVAGFALIVLICMAAMVAGMYLFRYFDGEASRIYRSGYRNAVYKAQQSFQCKFDPSYSDPSVKTSEVNEWLESLKAEE